MSSLYPLKFKTIYKDKIWGGQKIRTYLGKDFSPLPNCGETWEDGIKYVAASWQPESEEFARGFAKGQQDRLRDEMQKWMC